jgi:predicted enzyme related to lactoylglutathione lyase
MITDMSLAIEFYTQILELELKNRYGNHYAEIQAPGLLIGLHPVSEKLKIGNNLSIGFGVTDFDTARKNLAEKGIQLREELDGPIRLAHFSDPDKNALYLADLSKG